MSRYIVTESFLLCNIYIVYFAPSVYRYSFFFYKAQVPNRLTKHIKLETSSKFANTVIRVYDYYDVVLLPTASMTVVAGIVINLNSIETNRSS